MPSLTFVLPHWLYWAALALFPLGAMFLMRRERAREKPVGPSLALGYFLWLVGGFVGLHRFYTKSWIGVFYIPLFLAILFGNVQDREARAALSNARNALQIAKFDVERAEKAVARGRSGAAGRLDTAREAVGTADAGIAARRADFERWQRFSWGAALLIALFLVFDATRLPRLIRRARASGAGEKTPPSPLAHLEEPLPGAEGPAGRVPLPGIAAIDALNGFVGQFVAYWSVIAVFVYFYEVMARYVFNSPTNWAHESMFLMFGMQYLLSGGYALREGAHVRVDVIYGLFSPRAKAAIDVVTSVFFFIFTGTLVWTGWVFFADSAATWEVSFTEWAIQYWTVKLAIPLGAALLLLQGLVRLAKDIAVLLRPEVAPDGA